MSHFECHSQVIKASSSDGTSWYAAWLAKPHEQAAGTVVLLQALGGMAVAVVAKYADNISTLGLALKFNIYVSIIIDSHN